MCALLAMCRTSHLLLLLATAVSAQQQEVDLAEYLSSQYEPQASLLCNRYSLAAWDYNTDLAGAGKAEAVVERSLEYANFRKQQWQEHFKDLDLTSISNETLARQVKFLKVLGTSALDDSRLTELNNITTRMEGVYSRAKICPFTNQSCDLQDKGLSLDPEIEDIMAKSRNYKELEYVWKAWRDATGPKMRDDYKNYVVINNEAAKLNNMSDYGAMWREGYESETFVRDMDALWKQVEPLYAELHTYVLGKLRDKYGNQLGDDGLIPAHLLGNMWAQSWRNIYDLLQPYPNAMAVDVTSSLKSQGYTARRMFETSDNFYQSLGLPSNSMSYNESRAMIEKPTDGREVVCHASAWDFCDRQDFRIKMCTSVNMKDFVTIHHEMGHIQYYIQYKDQPISFRKGANPGFHEAVGDTIALSVGTPQHLSNVDLLENYQDSDENDINALMQIALDKVAFLPFGLLIDKWRWDVFSGDVTEQQWNSHWWKLREQYQKVKAPVPRSEQDFDPGAKYHIPGDSQYIAYFVAHILQFQMHKALCIAAGQYDASNATAKPLHKCDIYQSIAAGQKLSAGLSLGGSKHWSVALEAMTGESTINGSAILEYFQPLQDFLRRSNEARAAEQSSQVVPIVVAAVLLVLVVIVIAGYVVARMRRARARRRDQEDIPVEEVKSTAADEAEAKVEPKVEPEAETKAEEK